MLWRKKTKKGEVHTRDPVDQEMEDTAQDVSRMVIPPPKVIVEYSFSFAISIFAFLFVASLFFPSIVGHPDISFLKEFIEMIHNIIHIHANYTPGQSTMP